MSQILEYVLAPPASVDVERGIIYGAKMLGRVSKNGREYSDQAMNDACRLYEGAVINIDHPDQKDGHKPRGFLEGIAVAQNCKRSGQFVVGDLHVIKSHPAAASLLEWAQRFPGKFGLSHNADGLEVNKGGKRVVESLDRVISVDVVRNPATVASLFESVGSDYPASREDFLRELRGTLQPPTVLYNGTGKAAPPRKSFKESRHSEPRPKYPATPQAFSAAIGGTPLAGQSRQRLFETDGMNEPLPGDDEEQQFGHDLQGARTSQEVRKAFISACVAVLNSKVGTVEARLNKIRRLMQAAEDAAKSLEAAAA